MFLLILGLQESSAFTKDSHESFSGVLDNNGSCNGEAGKSPTLHTHESASFAEASSTEASILITPKSLVALSSNKLSDRAITVPIFVSHAPTGLTSPKALRSGFGKGNKDTRTYPSFIVDSHRESAVNTAFNKDKHNRTPKKRTGYRRSSPQLNMYFSSIAERTRSHASKYSHSAPPKVTKKAKRQLSKLEITMNAYQTNGKILNDDGLHNCDASEKSILSGNSVKKDSGKRKRPRKQPRSDLKKKRYNASNYQHPSKSGYAILDEQFDQPTQLAIDRTSKNYKNSDEIEQSSEAENKENGGKLDKSEGDMDKSEVNLDKSDGELDSSHENESEDDLEVDKDRRAFDETKEGEKNDTAVEKNKEKSEGKHKEDRNIDELVEAKENKNEDENMDDEELDKIDDKEDGKDKHKSQVNNKEVREVKFKQKKFEESHCAVENKAEKLVDESELEEERSEIDSIEENLEEQNKRELEEDKSEDENKEENLEEQNKRELEEEKSEVENKEENLEEQNKRELEEEKSEVENKEENLEEQNKRELEEDKSEVENKEENLEEGKNGGELENRSEIENMGDKLTDENEGEVGDKMEDENEEELEVNKNQVETNFSLQEDKNEGVLKDDWNGVEEKSEDKNEEVNKENKSDGELDSEEDESSNQTAQPTINASPGMKQGLFMKVGIVS